MGCPNHFLPYYFETGCLTELGLGWQPANNPPVTTFDNTWPFT